MRGVAITGQFVRSLKAGGVRDDDVELARKAVAESNPGWRVTDVELRVGERPSGRLSGFVTDPDALSVRATLVAG